MEYGNLEEINNHKTNIYSDYYILHISPENNQNKHLCPAKENWNIYRVDLVPGSLI
jgi:hypothetical protein